MKYDSFIHDTIKKTLVFSLWEVFVRDDTVNACSKRF